MNENRRVNRYLYLDTNGQTQGPLWLSQMRELYQSGRLSHRTEISLVGTDLWENLESYPEITTANLEVEDISREPHRPESQNASTWRLVRLVWALLLAYLLYLWKNGTLG